MNNILNDKIDNANTIAILGHINPDGDCLGSTLAIQNYIINKYNNKKTVEVFLEKASDKFNVLPLFDKIKNYPIKKVFDLCIVCDVATKERIKEFLCLFEMAKDKIVIDHHESNDFFCKDIILDKDSPATSQIVFDLLDKKYIDKKVATCLYIGIAHDTGVFRYSQTTSHTMEIAGFLMDRDLDFTNLLDVTIFFQTLQQKKLSLTMLDKCIYLYKEKVIFSYITIDELNKYDLTYKDIDQYVVILREICGVEIAFFAYELKKDVYKISMRCNGNRINCSNFAKTFNGGGHKKASGFTINGNVNVMIEELRLAINKLYKDIE